MNLILQRTTHQRDNMNEEQATKRETRETHHVMGATFFVTCHVLDTEQDNYVSFLLRLSKPGWSDDEFPWRRTGNKEWQTRLVREAGCMGLSQSICIVTVQLISNEAKEQEQRGGE